MGFVRKRGLEASISLFFSVSHCRLYVRILIILKPCKVSKNMLFEALVRNFFVFSCASIVASPSFLMLKP